MALVPKSFKSTEMLPFQQYLNEFRSYQTINYSRISIPTTNTLVTRQHSKSSKRNLQTSISLTRHHIKKQSECLLQYQNSLTSQSNNANKINLQQISQLIMQKDKKDEQYLKNEMIRNLNGTWFQQTINSNDFTSRIYNTIGVKRNRSLVKQNRERYNPELDYLTSNKKYHPPNIFPSRKRISQSKKILVNFNDKYQRRDSKLMKKNQGQFKFQVIKAVTQKSEGKRPLSRIASVSPRRSSTSKTVGSLNGNKVANLQTLSAVKGMKMTIYE